MKRNNADGALRGSGGVLIIIALIWATGWVPCVNGQSRQEAYDQIETWRQLQDAEAEERVLATAFFSLDDAEADLMFISKVAETLPVDLSVTTASGDRVPLGRFSIEPTTHLRVELDDLLLRMGQSSVNQGAVAAHYFGVPGDLQAWLVQSQGTRAFELPFQDPDTQKSMLTFWNPSQFHREGHRPVLHATNLGTLPVTYSLQIQGVNGDEILETVMLSPGQTTVHSIHSTALSSAGPATWLEIHSDGPGLVISAFVTDRSFRSPLPLIPTSSDGSTEFHSVSIPAGRGARSVLTLMNRGNHLAKANIDFLDLDTGGLVTRKRTSVPAGKVRSITIEHFSNLPMSGREYRARIRTTKPIHAIGQTYLGDRGIGEWALFSRESAHVTGSYPLPSLDEYTVKTTLVNLAEVAADVVGQIFWSDGAYSFGPYTVPAHGSIQIDPEDLVESGGADLSGRTLDPGYRDGMLRWLSQGPSKDLIARTEVRRREPHGGLYGFNCKSCCESVPFASISPGLAKFPLGQSHAFQATVSYAECDGEMGPFAVEPDIFHTPSQFAWDGSTISGYESADADVEYEEYVRVLTFLCRVFWKWITGVGRAELCQSTHNPKGYDGSKTCTSQTNDCEECQSCCSAIYLEKICRGKRQDIAQGEKNTCDGHCLTDAC